MSKKCKERIGLGFLNAFFLALCFATLIPILYALSVSFSGQNSLLSSDFSFIPKDFTLENYTGEAANIRSVHKAENGFVIETVTYGYAGEITMYIGVNNDGCVTGLVVRDMSETFGLGAQALTDHVFLSQFLNISGQAAVGTPGADAFSGATGESTEAEAEVYVDAISGATVTSKAIVRCVNSAVAYVTGADVSSSATSWGG